MNAQLPNGAFRAAPVAAPAMQQPQPNISWVSIATRRWDSTLVRRTRSVRSARQPPLGHLFRATLFKVPKLKHSSSGSLLEGDWCVPGSFADVRQPLKGRRQVVIGTFSAASGWTTGEHSGAVKSVPCFCLLRLRTSAKIPERPSPRVSAREDGF